MSVKSILADQRVKFAGGALSADTVAALARHRRNSGAVGLVVLLAVIVGAVLAAYMSYAAKPGEITLIAGGLGLSVGAALLLLLRVWHEWSESGLLMVLIEDADEATVRAIIDKLVSKL